MRKQGLDHLWPLPLSGGTLKVMIPENLTVKQVVEKNPLVELGGQYQPPDCWAWHHIAVVVPYYGQAQYLQHLLFHLHPFLQCQPLHCAIYVVNQLNNTAFNQGKLCNMGFWEAMQEDWDCVFFHDVNLLEDNCNLYTCDISPAHVSVATDKFNYKLPYPDNLGGVFALCPVHHPLRINGFPNTHWGWHPPPALWPPPDGGGVAGPQTQAEPREFWPPSPDPRQVMTQWHDGTSSVGYRLLSKELQPLYTNLTVDINFFYYNFLL
ncbi:LOW QUALITY PROTEIN: beta-1,4-galactosyltransferase 3-like [Hipposideros larvatus]